ncbi:hypothetical protein B0H14DRAFT_3496699 [Mycena olivaceomarginata]|nr:hypothetical protein B0H14DRAFT_3496699 [Mycena olivaceomarginata]
MAEEEVERAARGGENVRVMSWIWTGAGLTGDDGEIEDALRVEWTKAYARVRRWREEQLLVQEEVRRAGVTLEFRAKEWEERARGVPVSSDERQEWREVTPWVVERSEGAITYALKQAQMYRNIARRVTVSMAEERRGRGKRRRLLYDDEWVNVEGGGEATEEGEGVEEDIDTWRAEEVAETTFSLAEGQMRIDIRSVASPHIASRPLCRLTPTIEQGGGGVGEPGGAAHPAPDFLKRCLAPHRFPPLCRLTPPIEQGGGGAPYAA